MSGLRQKNKKNEKKRGVLVHAPLRKGLEVQGALGVGKYDATIFSAPPDESPSDTLDGLSAMQWARELSKLPDGDFHLAFFPYSRKRDEACARLTVKEHCKWRTQASRKKISIDPDNLLLFTDGEGNERMCYRILIRYMAFSQDGYRLHRIDWL